MKLLLAVALAIPLAAQTVEGQKAEAMLGAALHHERVTGNLQAAIDGYRKLLAAKGVSRSLAARAQYHIGLCHEKLGDREARKAFETVVTSYADQKDLVAQARARLAGMAGEAASVRTRLLWDHAIDLWGSTSADGRYLSFVDWGTCDLGVRDLVTGENRKLTNFGGCAKGEVEPSAVSHDGRWIAFAYRDNTSAQLLVIGADGKGQKVLVQGNGLAFVQPYSWSPDGKWIAAVLLYQGSPVNDVALGIVSAESGVVRRLPVNGMNWPYAATFSPDGRWVAYSASTPGTAPTLWIRGLEGNATAEAALIDSAMMMGWTPDGSGILFSRERGVTNDLYLLPMSEGKPAGEAIPIYSASDVGTFRAGVTANGSLLFKTQNRRSETVVLPWNGDGLAGKTPVIRIAGTGNVNWLLGSGASHFSNDGKRLFSVTPAPAITIRTLDSGSERTITPLMTSWRTARWAHDDRSLLVLGHGKDGKHGIYRIDDATGAAVLVAELPVDTWSFALSRDGKAIYHGKPQQTLARDLATGADRTLLGQARGGNYDLRVSRDGNRLAVRSSKGLVIVDLRSGQSREIYRSPEGSPIAIWALDWSADDKQLVGIVRPEVGAVKMESWVFSPEGGDPKRQPNPPELRGLSFSPDGKYVATTSLTQRWQVWALENFLPARK